MRSREAIWFECKVRYEKVTEEGTQKKVTEQHVVDALSFSEAEQRIIEKMSAYISGEFEVTDVKKAQYKEVFFDDESDRWYKAKLMFITIDEKTEKEKRSAVTYLVQAGTLDGAVKNINEVMGGTMIDYEKSTVSETKILDVFEYQKKGKTADELLDSLAEELRDKSKSVEEIVDKYVSTATPELRQQLIERLTDMRNKLEGNES